MSAKGVYCRYTNKGKRRPNMKTNDIKKGTRVKLRNGWEAVIKDNMKGVRRMAEVYGTYTEIGSVYSHDIVQVQVDGEWLPVEHTKDQLACKEAVDAFDA
jgi:hypothetical protein